jgi:hypothetical protein
MDVALTMKCIHRTKRYDQTTAAQSMQPCHEIKPKRTSMTNNKRIKRKTNYESIEVNLK